MLAQIEMTHCPDCKGTGERTFQCLSCDGTGEESCRHCGGTGQQYTAWDETWRDCPRCRGFGRLRCPCCEGRGYRREMCESCVGVGYMPAEDAERLVAIRAAQESARRSLVRTTAHHRPAPSGGLQRVPLVLARGSAAPADGGREGSGFWGMVGRFLGVGQYVG